MWHHKPFYLQDTFTIPVLGTRVTINGLKPGTEYNVTAQTALDRLRSEDSDPVVFTTGKLKRSNQKNKICIILALFYAEACNELVGPSNDASRRPQATHLLLKKCCSGGVPLAKLY